LAFRSNDFEPIEFLTSTGYILVVFSYGPVVKAEVTTGGWERIGLVFGLEYIFFNPNMDGLPLPAPFALLCFSSIFLIYTTYLGGMTTLKESEVILMVGSALTY
jgi:hypothetical protein